MNDVITLAEAVAATEAPRTYERIVPTIGDPHALSRAYQSLVLRSENMRLALCQQTGKEVCVERRFHEDQGAVELESLYTVTDDAFHSTLAEERQIRSLCQDGRRLFPELASD